MTLKQYRFAVLIGGGALLGRLLAPNAFDLYLRLSSADYKPAAWDNTCILVGGVCGFGLELLLQAFDGKPKRFSLRTLLAATTVVAVVLGLIVWSNEKPLRHEFMSLDTRIQGTLADRLPPIDQINDIVLTNWTTPTGSSKHSEFPRSQLPKEDWPRFLSLFKKTRPIHLYVASQVIGNARISVRSGEVFNIEFYYMGPTGFTCSLDGQDFDAEGDKSVVTEFLPKWDAE